MPVWWPKGSFFHIAKNDQKWMFSYMKLDEEYKSEVKNAHLFLVSELYAIL